MMGEKLDRFELIAELATGGMGTVFLARLGGVGGFHRLYAIKRLHEHLAKHGEFVEMFLDEARLAARIHHPNVVPILEVGTTAGHYVVMEYIEGDTAAHLFSSATKDGKGVPLRVGIRIVLDSLAGLHAAHEGSDDEGNPLEIVHRDVSPHNILVGVDGVSRITDFGVARAASRLAITRSGQLKGKLAYMAPEQARSEKVDRRADLFAMGICLWEMLTHQRLFKGEGEGDTLNRVLYEPIPTPTSVLPTVAPELEAVCMKALTRDPDKRFATAAEFSDALESAARSLDAVGTQREVAVCVSEVLGTDLAERRATVRAWLGDEERSRSLLPPPPDPSGDLGSNPGGVPAAAASSTAAYASLAPESGTLRAHAEVPRAPPGAERHRASRLGVAVVVGAVALTAVAAEWWRTRPSGANAAAAPEHAVAASGVPSVDPPSPAPSGAPSPIDSNEAVLSPSSAIDTPRLAASVSAKPARPGRVSGGSSSQPSVSTAPRSAPAPSVPPDMVINPYR